MAITKKLTKEQPRYKVQSEYELKFKKNFRQMLNSMNKALIFKMTQITK